ncbi:hypothetical protein [uncultured Roseibium sp.]|uniref:hypothetical protein n=1 Tax=uncultured Roseibium sp. TaxID=1936171 RepID=UPI002602F40E|nr:hypothetical protein [uncultured Roseibium sp.]
MTTGRRSQSKANEIDREALLSALSVARASLIEAQRCMRPRSGLARSAKAVISEIDEFAFVLTGTENYFYTKAHGTPPRSVSTR